MKRILTLLFFLPLFAAGQCDTVTSISATAIDHDGATISFTTPNAHLYYVILYNGQRQNVNDPGGPYPAMVTAPLTGLTPSTVYTYSIVAYCSPTDSAEGSDFWFTTTAAPCDTVTAVVATPTSGGVTITTTGATYGTSYILYYIRAGETDTLTLADADGDFTISSGLRPASLHYYQIATICSGTGDTTRNSVRAFTTTAAVNYTQMTGFGYQEKRAAFDSTLSMPTMAEPSLRNGKNDKAAIIYDTVLQAVAVFNPLTQDWEYLVSSGDGCTEAVSYVNTIAELEAYSGSATSMVVTDSLRGGIFNYYVAGLTTDDGVVFDATGKGAGYWKRQTTESDAVNVAWFGAIGDGSTDNTDAFQSASRYRKVIVPKGTYKLDKTQLNTTNYYLDSAVITSTTYEPYIPGFVESNYDTRSYSYSVYNPTVTIDTVFAGVPSTYQYNHDATLAYFNSKFYVFWNGNPTGGTEGASNQLNYMSTSTDANHWTTIVAPFDNATYTNNPMPYLEASMKQWQPNAIVLADRMLVFWTETQSSPNGWATYMSVLLEGATKFTTYRIDINSTTRVVDMNSDLSSSPASGYSTLYPSDNDSSYTLFSTQNPYLLNRGRLLAPFVAQNQTGLFYERDKFATVLYSDSPADTTSYKFGGLFQGGTTASAWEPYFTESKNGDVYMHLRNLGIASTVTTDANQELLISSDGINFGSASNDGIIAPSSRAYAQRMSNNRYGMSFNDADNNIRVNGSFLLSRFGEIDFAQGVSLQKNTDFPGDSYFNYPQSIVYRDTVYVAYTNFFEPRSVVLAKFKMPTSDNILSIIPRNRPKKYVSSYADVGNTRLNMTGSRSLLMNVPMIVGDADSINSHQSVSFSFWAQKQSDYSTATLFDSRGSTLSDADFKQKGGGIASSFVTMGNSNTNVNLVDNMNYSLTNYTGLTTRLLAFPSYLGLSFDTPNKTLSIYYDDGTCSGCNASQFYDKYYYWQAVEITQNWADGETVTIDGAAYTARNSPSLSTEFQIDDSLVVTCSNLKSVVTGFDIVGFGDTTNLLASDTIMMAFFKTASFATITSTNAGVSDYAKNLFDSPAGQYGAALSTTSTLTGIGGWIYNLRIYRGATDGVLSAANHRYLFNRLASTFGYTNKTSTTAATNFYVNLQYDSLNDVTYQFTNQSRTEYEYSSDTLTLYSNSSAGIEAEGEEFTLSVQFKATIPTDDDVPILSFQDRDNSNEITIDSSGNIKLNGIPVTTVVPEIKNNLTLTYKGGKLLINGTFKYELNNRPRFYLGNYSVFNNMGDEYYVTYYLNKTSCTVLK